MNNVQKMMCFLIAVFALVWPCTASAAEPVTFSLSIHNYVTGDTPPSPNPFTFVLTAENYDYPMPDGALNGQMNLVITGPGKQDVSFLFGKAGEYVYHLYENKGTVSNYTYDSTRYELKVSVLEKNDELNMIVTLENQNTGKKTSFASFTNRYITSETPKTSDNRHTTLLLTLMIVLLFAIAVVLVVLLKRRHRNKDDE